MKGKIKSHMSTFKLHINIVEKLMHVDPSVSSQWHQP